VTEPTLPPPGWYADPAPDSGRQLRFWDGSAWTAQTSGHAAPPLPGRPHPAEGFRGVRRADRTALPSPPPWTPTVDTTPREHPGFWRTLLGTAPLDPAHHQHLIASARHATAGPLPLGTAAPHQVLRYLPFLVVGLFVLGNPAARLLHVPLFWVAAVVLPLWTARTLTRYWRLVDTPTLDLGGLRVGDVEVAGTLTSDAPVEAPVSRATVCWAEVKVEELVRRGKSSSWVTRHAETHGWPHAVLGDGRYEVHLPGWAPKLSRSTASVTHGRWRVLERAAVVGDPALVHARVTADGTGLVVPPPGVGGGRSDVALGGEEPAVRRLRTSARATGIGGLGAVVLAATTRPTFDGFAFRSGAGGTLALALAVTSVPLAVAYLVRLYNRIVAADEQAASSWSWIVVELRRRHQLIGDLAAVVRAAWDHERHVQVAAALARLDPDVAPDEEARRSTEGAARADAETASMLRAAGESAPALSGDVHAAALIGALIECEDRIAAARAFHNDAVTVHVDLVRTVPGVFLRPLVDAPRPLLDLGLGPHDRGRPPAPSTR
jgi:LemA protein